MGVELMKKQSHYQPSYNEVMSDMDFVRDQLPYIGRMVKAHTLSVTQQRCWPKYMFKKSITAVKREMDSNFQDCIIAHYKQWRRERLPQLKKEWKANCDWEKSWLKAIELENHEFNEKEGKK
jgi:hypothetical protein